MNLPDAHTLLDAAESGRSINPAGLTGGATVDDGLVVQRAIAALRRARGEREAGWKIGFTNRTIWPLYGVHQPIAGPVWDTTLHRLDGTLADVRIARLPEPRLEPEVVFGLRASPPADADATDADRLRALVDCIDWVAHGIEVVASVWPGWRFDAAQAVAAQALHGGLWVGPRVPIGALGADPAGVLSRLRLVLSLEDVQVAEGTGANVLDGPVQALGHLVAVLAARGERIAAGAVVTTGTLTDAQPMRAGQVWRTRVSGAPLAGLQVRVA